MSLITILSNTPQKTNYVAKVLSYSPIAYWPMGEASGLTSVEQMNSPAQDGVYTGVTLGQTGIGDGETCPLFDGANDFNNIHSATFAGSFSGATGTIMIWLKVSGVGAWSDATARIAVHMGVDNNNQVYIRKSLTAGRLTWYYVAGGTAEMINDDGHSETGWVNAAITWDVNAGATGEVKAYLSGSQVGSTATGLGVWVGSLASTLTAIGAHSTTPLAVWDGYLAHVSVWDVALGSPAIADLAVV